MKPPRAAVIVGAILSLGGAAEPSDRLSDPAKESHARALFRETRCLVCQGQSIDDSDAELADDLRRIIRAQVAAGRSDAEIRAFLKARYGDFVLLRPPFDFANALLWIGPFLIIGAGAFMLILRMGGVEPSAQLSAEEEARVKALTRENAP